MPFGSRYPESERMTVPVNEQMPFSAGNPVFTGEIDGIPAAPAILDNAPVAVGVSKINQFFLKALAFSRSNIFFNRPEYLSCLSALLATEYEQSKSWGRSSQRQPVWST